MPRRLKAAKLLFIPKPGQTDFTDIRYAPIINCVLKHKGKFLVIKRSEILRWYPGRWNGVSGFLDDKKSIKEKITEEINEELGLKKTSIKSIKLKEIFLQDEPKYQKTWIVIPVLVEVNTSEVKLNFENAEYKWATESEIKKLKFVPGFDEVLRRVNESRI